MARADMHWQVQEAKQRFSELLRAVADEGAQYVTKHGREIAVVISIDEFHRLTGGKPRYKDFDDWLLNGPKIDLPDDEFDALFARSREPDTRETPFVGPDWE
jgi:prevent-host-death family protein